MGDVLLEREFNYLLYGTLHVLPPEYIRLIQDGCQRNAKMIFSLLDTINYKKKRVGKNYAKSLTKLHKDVY